MRKIRMRKAALEIKTDAFTGSKLGNVSQRKSPRDPKGRILKRKICNGFWQTLLRSKHGPDF